MRQIPFRQRQRARAAYLPVFQNLVTTCARMRGGDTGVFRKGYRTLHPRSFGWRGLEFSAKCCEWRTAFYEVMPRILF